MAGRTLGDRNQFECEMAAQRHLNWIKKYDPFFCWSLEKTNSGGWHITIWQKSALPPHDVTYQSDAFGDDAWSALSSALREMMLK